MIQFLAHGQIDKQKWDRCINDSRNGLIYAYSWYLDRICPGWHALVLGDYSAVMPLPARKKFGIAYLFTPYYAQQLGVFGENSNEDTVRKFIEHVPADFRLMDIKFNESNLIPPDLAKIRGKKNYIINMAPGYDSLRSNYSRNCRRNIKKAEESGMKAGDTINAAEFAEFIRKNLKAQMNNLDARAIDLLEHITGDCIARGLGEIVTIMSNSGKLSAAGLFLFHGKRLIFSVCASSTEGKQNHAMYMLVDQQIRKYAGKYEVFDFSGSDIKGIAYFNSTFGAEPKTYYLVHINRLNWVQRLISRKIR